MADNGSVGARRSSAPPELPDPRKSHASRTYDALLGGKDNLAVDRDQVGENLTVMPEAGERVMAQRLFVERAAAWLARAGVRQILDIGCGLPNPKDNIHEIVQRVDPEIRVVYVDNNPVTVAHMDALHADGETTIALQGDLRDPGGIVQQAAEVAALDFNQPVAVLLSGILHFIGDEAEPGRLIAELREKLAAGSYVVITHISAELDERVHDVVTLFEDSATPMVQRGRAEVSGMLEGLDPVAPGLVPVNDWDPSGSRPDGAAPGLASVHELRPTGSALSCDTYGAVARKG